MQDDVAYGILEMTYISRKVTEEKNYEKVLEEEIPSDWYGINIQNRISILNEAIANGLSLTETSLYLDREERKKGL